MFQRAPCGTWLAAIALAGCARTVPASGQDAGAGSSHIDAAADRAVAGDPDAGGTTQVPAGGGAPAPAGSPAVDIPPPPSERMGSGTRSGMMMQEATWDCGAGICRAPSPGEVPGVTTFVPLCCTPEGRCGLVLYRQDGSALCVERDQPGVAHAGCPEQSVAALTSVPLSTTEATLAGCCRPDGECGVATPPSDVGFGCLSRSTLVELQLLGESPGTFLCDPDSDGGI